MEYGFPPRRSVSSVSASTALPLNFPAECDVTTVPDARVPTGRTMLPPTVIGAPSVAEKRSPSLAVFVSMASPSTIVSCVPEGIVMGGGGGGAIGAAGAAFEALGCEAAPEFELGFDDEESAGAVAGAELLDAGAGVDDLLQPPIVSTTATARN